MRKLSLKVERLAELTTDDLHRVAAAAPAPPTYYVRDCIGKVPTLFGCTTAMTCPRPDAE